MDGWPLEIFTSPVRTEHTRIKCGCCKQYHWRPESVRLCYLAMQYECYRDNPSIAPNVTSADDLYQFTGTDAGPMS